MIVVRFAQLEVTWQNSWHLKHFGTFKINLFGGIRRGWVDGLDKFSMRERGCMKIVKLRSCFSINFNSQIVEGSTYLWHHSLIDDHKLNVEGNLVLVAWSGTNKGIYGSCGVSKNTNAELQAIIYHGISVAWLQSQTHPRRRFLLPTLIILLSTRFGVTYSSIGTFVFNILSEMLIG